MPTYRVWNALSGADIGAYDAATPEEALDAMARDAGYADYAAACADVPAEPGEIVVREETNR